MELLQRLQGEAVNVLVESGTEAQSSREDAETDQRFLYGAGYKRPQIADRLGLSERTVKRELLAIMDQARTILARLAGGGCLRGEPMVVRFVCGVSTPDESAQAREHLSHCERCELFSERLIAWREKAGAMLPAPVAEGGSTPMACTVDPTQELKRSRCGRRSDVIRCACMPRPSRFGGPLRRRIRGRGGRGRWI